MTRRRLLALFAVGVLTALVFTRVAPRGAEGLTDGDVATFAGGGLTLSGDPSYASMAPWAIATDTNGDFYVTDLAACRVSKVTTNPVTSVRTITWIAGGQCGYGGDGAAADQAALDRPR